jgi:mitochondrial fission protein ELM1
MQNRAMGNGVPYDPPRVWALLGHRTGDNLQVETLADALGWPYERKVLSWREQPVRWTSRYGRMGPSLAPLTANAQAAIIAPWPDLVLSVGWRSVPVARWIRRESGARLVHIGRPRAPLNSFDLVLSTAQYRLPKTANVVRLDAPMTSLSAEALANAAAQWRDRLAHLPRPWIAVLIGGDAPPLFLTPEAVSALGTKANALALGHGGSLLVATGPRTGEAATQAFLAQVDAPMHSYLWGSDGENPYLGYLALADEIIVTGDSISMVHEASLTGKAVHLFELPIGGPFRKRVFRWIDRQMRAHGGIALPAYQMLIRNGWINPPRAPDEFHDELIRSGRAVRLGDLAKTPGTALASTSTERAVAAIHELFDG